MKVQRPGRIVSGLSALRTGPCHRPSRLCLPLTPALSQGEREKLVARPVDVVIVNTGHPDEESLARYADEHKEPLPVGDVPCSCEVVSGEFWRGAFARHARRWLAYAVWGVLSQRLL